MKNYKITFRGEISSGYSAEKVKQDTAQIFKLNTNQLQKIFSGSKVTLKKDISHEQAQKYQAKLQSLGLQVYIEQEEMAFSIIEDKAEDFKAMSPIYHSPTSSAHDYSSTQGNQAPRHDYARAPDNHNTMHHSDDAYGSRDGFDEIPDFLSLDFSGRIGRLTYINYIILYILILTFPGIVAALLFPFIGSLALILMIISVLICLVLYFRITILRLHDINLTGWLSLLELIPIVNAFFSLFLLCCPGSVKANNYGRPVAQGSYVGLIIFVAIFLLGIIAGILLP